MEHLQSEEPFFSDPYFSLFYIYEHTYKLKTQTVNLQNSMTMTAEESKEGCPDNCQTTAW